MLSPNLTYVGDRQVIDAKEMNAALAFDEHVLRGRIYHEDKNLYMAESMDLSYSTQGSELHVNSICNKKKFIITNFDKDNKLGIRLSKNPTKEIGLVVCTLNP